MDSCRPRVLVVDDEQNIAYLVKTALVMDGYDVELAGTGAEASEAIRCFSPHVVILDVMLPDTNGFDLLARLRRSSIDVPVIFLSARHEPTDRVRGLTVGGDDYITKPFSVEELLARVRIVVRRSGLAGVSNVLRCADLELDEEKCEVRRGSREIRLSPTEYKLLRYLLLNVGKVMSKANILDHVWEYDFGGDASSVENYISYLRKKIDTEEPRLIHTIRGFGYALRAPAVEA